MTETNLKKGDTVRLHYRRNGAQPGSASCVASVEATAQRDGLCVLDLKPDDPALGRFRSVPPLGERIDGVGYELMPEPERDGESEANSNGDDAGDTEGAKGSADGKAGATSKGSGAKGRKGAAGKSTGGQLEIGSDEGDGGAAS